MESGRSSLEQHQASALRRREHWARTGVEATSEQGAATSVLLASSPLLEGIGGRYFEDCNEASIATRGNDYMSGVAPYALNPNNADCLCEESLRLLT